MLKRFKKGNTPEGLAMLNGPVDELNSLGRLRGDDKFIFLNRGPGGGIVFLDINAVLARVPRPTAGSNVTISGKFTGNASGNGKYTGKSFADPTSDVSASGNLSEADLGTLAAADDCLLLNVKELGVSNTGHDVTAATNTAQFSLYFTGQLIRVNSDGKKVVRVSEFWVGC